MFVITHTCIPIIAADGANRWSLASTGEPMFERRAMALIGLFGALPDLLNPHLSRAARYASWSHTVWFLFGVGGLLALACAVTGRPDRRLGIALWSAVALHLFGDLVSGGIVPFRPLWHVAVGAYLVSPAYWLHLDLATALGAYALCLHTRRKVLRLRAETIARHEH